MMERWDRKKQIGRNELTVGTTFKVFGVTKGREESSFGSSSMEDSKKGLSSFFSNWDDLGMYETTSSLKLLVLKTFRSQTSFCIQNYCG
jgi:hypothetical protein